MKSETAVLAGGCFWGMEELFRQIKGVSSTEVGYCGGDGTSPTYKVVKTGQSGFAEALKIEFDPTVISYPDVIRFFFRIHDPTTVDRQGNDVGSQYRSAIFPINDQQLAEARAVIAEVDRSGVWKQPVVTKLERFVAFWPAEEEHQDYLQKHPNGYTCHYFRG